MLESMDLEENKNFKHPYLAWKPSKRLKTLGLLDFIHIQSLLKVSENKNMASYDRICFN